MTEAQEPEVPQAPREEGAPSVRCIRVESDHYILVFEATAPYEQMLRAVERLYQAHPRSAVGFNLSDGYLLSASDLDDHGDDDRKYLELLQQVFNPRVRDTALVDSTQSRQVYELRMHVLGQGNAARSSLDTVDDLKKIDGVVGAFYEGDHYIMTVLGRFEEDGERILNHLRHLGIEPSFAASRSLWNAVNPF